MLPGVVLLWCTGNLSLLLGIFSPHEAP
jgi:hypothetical protein